jgi:hypothetical protein
MTYATARQLFLQATVQDGAIARELLDATEHGWHIVPPPKPHEMHEALTLRSERKELLDAFQMLVVLSSDVTVIREAVELMRPSQSDA